MYKRFYLLDRNPFEHLAGPEFIYLSRHHKQTLTALIDGITTAKGAILLAGDAGTGKTILVQTLSRHLSQRFVLIDIHDPRSDIEGIMLQLARRLSIHFIEQNHTREIRSKIKLRLSQLRRGGKRIVLVIDQAHRLDGDCLNHMRRCFNDMADDRELLQVVLVGRRDIFDTLQTDFSESLEEWFSSVCILLPMERKEVKEYILHRLAVAGRRAPLFGPRALGLIWRNSGGVPRIINQICESALVLGTALRSRKIGRKIIKKVAGRIDRKNAAIASFRHHRRNDLQKILLISVLAFLILMGWTGKLSTKGFIDGPFKKEIRKSPAVHTPAAPVDPIPPDPHRPVHPEVRPEVRKDAKPALPNPCLVQMARNRYGTGNDTVIDLLQTANPSLRNVAGECTGQSLVFPAFRKTDLIGRNPDGTFFIHYASFYTPESAEKLAEDLRTVGLHVSIVNVPQGENIVFRIHMNGHQTIAQAAAALTKRDLVHLSFLQPEHTIRNKALLEVLEDIK